MMVSLLLVELVSPDVMYNGLPWPDEEFTKVIFIAYIIRNILLVLNWSLPDNNEYDCR